MSDLYPRIYHCIREIPSGAVATYGQIASMVGCGPRQVGYALAALRNKVTDIPWHRVLNRAGRISVRSSDGFSLQQELLEAEGVLFNLDNRVNLGVFGWQPEGGENQLARDS